MSSLMKRRVFDRNPTSLLERMSRMMDEAGVGYGGDSSELAAWSPSVNIYDKDGVLVVEADLPGVKKDDTQRRVNNGVLTPRIPRSEKSKPKSIEIQ